MALVLTRHNLLNKLSHYLILLLKAYRVLHHTSYISSEAWEKCTVFDYCSAIYGVKIQLLQHKLEKQEYRYIGSSQTAAATAT